MNKKLTFTDRIKWMDYNGKKVLYVSYSGLTPLNKDLFYKVADEAHQLVLDNTNGLLLIDVTNAYGDMEMLNLLKKNSKIEKSLVKKEAVIGISGAKNILLQSVNMFSGITIEPFSTMEEALNWLTKN